MGFQNSVDIANLALQFLGLPRINTTLGFTENSQRSQELSSAYGKLKRAELRRTVYEWATRRAALRPMDTNTMFLAPSLWASTTTYFRGSIIEDQDTFLWVSKVPNNTNNSPQNSPTQWEPYFGPISVMLYDSTKTYLAGELVYTALGDGTYNVYQSQVSGNGLDPSLPNIWSSDATYFQNNVVQTYPNWSSSTTYAAGATVLYTDGNYYSSLISSNHNNIPTSTIGTDWALLPILSIMPSTTGTIPAVGQPQGTLPQMSPVIEWNDNTVYSIGSFVLFAGNEYVSLVNANIDNPPNAAASTSWAILSGGTSWMSLIDLNINNNPTSTPANWSSTTTYAIGNVVSATDNYEYTSLINSNVNHNPANGLNPSDWSIGSLVPWTSTFTQGGGNQQWMQIGGSASPSGVALTTPDLIYPIGSGPSSESQTRNVYRLPAGYLREAPQDPKAGSTSWLGAPSGLWYNDWVKEGNYIVTRQTDPIVYRFVADVSDVTQFDDMVAAGLAYRLALAVAPILTNSAAKTQEIAQQYKQFMSEARIVGGIETGAIEPPEDDYIIARL